MNESNDNGHPFDNESIAQRIFARLSAIGGDEHQSTHTNGDAPFRSRGSENGDRQPPHHVERHSEDPPGAYQKAAREVVDPEEIRGGADWFGKASQAIDPEWFEWLVRRLYRGVHLVRIGAILIPAQREAGEQLKRSASTAAEIAAIQAEGTADAGKADRLEADVVPRVERELDDASGEVESTNGNVTTARRGVGRVRSEEEERRARAGDDRARTSWGRRWLRGSWTNLFGRVSLSPGKAWGTFGVEVSLSAILLAPKVADVVGTSFNEGLAIAFAISFTLLAASFAAGMALAAIRLPGWSVGLGTLGAFTAILIKFVPGLDALRESGPSGVATLTAATLAAFFIATISGYALSTAEDQRKEQEAEKEKDEVLTRAGTPLGDALDTFAEAKEAQKEAKDHYDRLKQLLSALWEQIERLRDAASRAPVAAEERRRQGIEAEVEAGTIRAVAEAAVEQEEAAADWAELIARAAHEKARVEEVPKIGVREGPVFAMSETSEVHEGDRLSALQGLALGTLAVSGISSLALGPVPLGIGIPMASLLLLADRWPGASRKTVSRQTKEAMTDRAEVVSPADGENQRYVRQPDRMVPKYRDGGAGVGERQ